MIKKIEPKVALWEKPLKSGEGKYLSGQMSLTLEQLKELSHQFDNAVLGTEVKISFNLFENSYASSEKDPKYRTPKAKPQDSNFAPF